MSFDIDNTNTDSQQSTIFSAPVVHEEKGPKNKKLWKKLLAAFLVVAIVAGTNLAVIKLIPEKEENENTAVTFNILDIDSDNIEKVEIKTDDNSLTLLSTLTETETSSDISWSIDGVNLAYTDSSAIKSAVSDAAVLEASKELTGPLSDYGLDNPKTRITLYPRNEAFSQVTVNLGNSAPANLGYYCNLSNSDKIYLVNSDIGELINVSAIDFATTSGLSGVVKTDDNADCFNGETLMDFDYITISGENYNPPLKIELQEDEALNAYFSYKITSPFIRIGDEDKITELTTLLASGITSSGAYAFDPDNDTLKLYQLDNPDITLTISVADKRYTILASKVDDNFYAAIDTYGGLIHKIPISSLTFATSKASDFYNSYIVIENLSGLSNIKAKFADGSAYDFKTIYESEGEVYKAFIGETELDITNFKAFYRQFITIAPVEQDSKVLTDTSLTITLVHSNGSADTVLSYKPYSSGRYQVEMNGIPMGLITKTTYEKLANNIKNVANGTPVIE